MQCSTDMLHISGDNPLRTTQELHRNPYTAQTAMSCACRHSHATTAQEPHCLTNTAHESDCYGASYFARRAADTSCWLLRIKALNISRRGDQVPAASALRPPCPARRVPGQPDAARAPQWDGLAQVEQRAVAVGHHLHTPGRRGHAYVYMVWLSREGCDFRAQSTQLVLRRLPAGQQDASRAAAGPPPLPARKMFKRSTGSHLAPLQLPSALCRP